MSSYSYTPYVSVAQRRKNAEATARRLQKKGGQPLSPIQLSGNQIATTFWGKAWCKNLESYSDYSNRLPRGRSYVRNGSVIDLKISNGTVEARVQGSSLYTVRVHFKPLAPSKWKDFKGLCAGKITNLLDLLQGRLSKEILATITSKDTGLFPAPSEIKLACSCPDSAVMCKHVAATLYGVGARLDDQPDLFFTLRDVPMEDLVAEATSNATTSISTSETSSQGIAEEDLSALFGIDIDTTTAPASPAAEPIAVPKPAARKLSSSPVAPKKATSTSKKTGKSATKKTVPKPKRKPAKSRSKA
jgi:uncharacterized Zn finger protein